MSDQRQDLVQTTGDVTTPTFSDQELYARALQSANMTAEQFAKIPPSAQKTYVETARRELKHEWRARQKKRMHQQQQQPPSFMQISGPSGIELVDDNATVIDMGYVLKNDSKDDADYERFRQLYEDAMTLKHKLLKSEQIVQEYRSRLDADDIRAMEDDTSSQRAQLHAAIDEMRELLQNYTDQCRVRYQTYQEVTSKIADTQSDNFRAHTTRKIEMLKERVSCMTRDLSVVAPLS